MPTVSCGSMIRSTNACFASTRISVYSRGRWQRSEIVPNLLEHRACMMCNALAPAADEMSAAACGAGRACSLQPAGRGRPKARVRCRCMHACVHACMARTCSRCRLTPMSSGVPPEHSSKPNCLSTVPLLRHSLTVSRGVYSLRIWSATPAWTGNGFMVAPQQGAATSVNAPAIWCSKCC